jgi:hypothetical protein
MQGAVKKPAQKALKMAADDKKAISKQQPIRKGQQRGAEQANVQASDPERRPLSSFKLPERASAGGPVPAKKSRDEETAELMQKWDQNIKTVAEKFNEDLDAWFKYTASRVPRRNRTGIISLSAAARPGKKMQPAAAATEKDKKIQPATPSTEKEKKMEPPDAMQVDEEDSAATARQKRPKQDEGSGDEQHPAPQQPPILNRKRFRLPNNISPPSSSMMLTAAKKLPADDDEQPLSVSAAVVRRSCLSTAESLAVLKQHGLIGQGSTVLAQAVLSS